VAALATIEDLEARLGRDLTTEEASRADALLQDVSALVCSYAGQDFTVAEDDTAVVRGLSGTIRLPQRPVTAVSSVVAIGGEGLPDVPLVDWVWDGIDTIRIGEGSFVVNLPAVWWDEDGYPGTYRVTYSHGYAQVPADVLAVICGVVTRVFGNPQGYRSETVGSYSVSYTTPGPGETMGAGLTRYDQSVLDRYRRTTGTIKVGR
jgi:hypothetical protein